MKILHLEDNPADAALVEALLSHELPLSEITPVATREEFIEQIQGTRFDVVLSDFRLKGFDGLEALELSRKHAPTTPFIFLSGTIGEDIAAETVRAGAHDYLLKDRIMRLPTALRNAADEARARQHRQVAEEAQLRLVDILENTTDFVGMFAPDTRMLYVNRAGQRLTRLPANTDITQLGIRDFHPPEINVHSLNQSLEEAARAGTWSNETILLTRDARHIPVSQVIIAHRSADTGQIEYFSTIMRDLSAQKAAEHRLREQAECIDKAHEAIILTDLEGRILVWNRGAENIYGWTAAEAIGRIGRELFGLENLAEIQPAREAVLKNGEWRGEHRLRNKHGQPLVVENSVTTIRDEAGQPKALLGISSDVTGKKLLEEQFLRAQRLESIGLLAAGIAHDLNNVLTPMLLAVPMLREGSTSPSDHDLLVALEEGTKRGAALVRQILGFVRGVSGTARVIDLIPLLRDIGGVIRGTFPKTITLEETIPASLPLVKANPIQVHQILLNLAVNARDAMANGGTIRLRAEALVLDEIAIQGTVTAHAGSYVVIHLEDTGTGISAELLDRIWEPFFTTKNDKGTGLGLSTVRGIAESHGGFVKVASTVGRGTTFSVFLPDAQSATAQDASPTAFNAPRGNGELILVVDDETQIRDLATATLARHGYRVLAARDGTEAVALFAPRSREIKLVITDLHMPNLGGSALAGIARRLNPAVKILMSSGLSVDEKEEGPPDSRLINAFLPKPFTVEALLATVHAQLNPPAQT